MKDWTGNKRTTFASLGASSHADHEREKHDYYATDPIAIDGLFEHIEFVNDIWECACGEGHLSKAMIEKGKNVKSTDLIDRGYGIGGVDFLKEPDIRSEYDIVTNPPFKYAMKFAEKAIKLTKSKVALFLRIQFLEGIERKTFFKKHPPKYVLVASKRIACAINGEFTGASSAACYAWFVWDIEHQGETTIKWFG